MERKSVVLMRRDGTRVRVPVSDHLYAAGAQSIGFGVGLTAAVVKMATIDLIMAGVKAAGNTEVGLGAKHGYQYGYYKRDTMIEERRLRAMPPEAVEGFARAAGIDTTNKTPQEICSQVAIVKAIGEDSVGRQRMKSFYKPIKVVESLEKKEVRVPDEISRRPIPSGMAALGDF